MVTPELLDFIRDGHASGMSDEALTQLLLGEGGWNRSDVDEAFQNVFRPKVPPTSDPDTSVVPSPVVAQSGDVANTAGTVADTAEIAPAPEIIAVVTEPVESFAKANPTVHLDSTRPALSLDEDFLGIFASAPIEAAATISSPESHVDPAPLSEPIKPSIVDDGTPVDIHVHEAMNSPSSEVGGVISMPVATMPAHTEAPLLNEVGATPQTSKTTVQTDASPQLVQLDDAPASVHEKTAPVKFNFEKLRSSAPAATKAPEAETPAMSEVVVPSLGAEINVQFASEVQIEPPVATPAAPVLSGDVIAKGEMLKKRTMASDMLLRGLSVPDDNSHSQSTHSPEIDRTPRATIISLQDPSASKSAKSVTLDDVHRQNHTKRVIAVAIGGLSVLLGLAGGAYILMNFLGPNAATLFGTAAQNFYGLKSLNYTANVTTALTLTNANGSSGVINSAVNLTLLSSGNLAMNAGGYGDGAHRVKLNGSLDSGAVRWPTDIDMDVRIIGSSLYFHLLALPEGSNLDPELFRTYWTKVDLSEIAKELSLSGVIAAEDGYGNFGGQEADASFNALLQKSGLFSSFDLLADDAIDGELARHIRMQVDPEKATQFILLLYRKYEGKELVLTDEERLRFKDALAKVTGEVWVTKKTNMLMKVKLRADLDDDIAGVHVKGIADIEFALSKFNEPSIVSPPAPILTLEELRVQMESYKVLSDTRKRDKEMVALLHNVVTGLGLYKAEKGRYPTILPELYETGSLASSTVPEETLKRFTFASYVGETPLTRANRCSAKSKTCAKYHIGVDLEEKESALLLEDSDVSSDIRGVDAAGCTGEAGKACYDVVSLPPQIISTATSTTQSSTGTPTQVSN